MALRLRLEKIDWLLNGISTAEFQIKVGLFQLVESFILLSHVSCCVFFKFFIFICFVLFSFYSFAFLCVCTCIFDLDVHLYF